MGTGGSFSLVNWPDREVDHSPPSSAEVKNDWSYTFTPTIFLHGVDWESFNFSQQINIVQPLILPFFRFILKCPRIFFFFFFFLMARQPYMGLGLLVSSRLHDHTHLRHTTVGRTPLDE
jgi:hypothetical protein